MEFNGALMQYFEWHLPAGILWAQLAKEAQRLAENGINAVWIPPPYKGARGVADHGYGVYDLYDLGEFHQKQTISTKYGTKEELLAAIKAAHAAGLEVYADIVLDHRMGADAAELVMATECAPRNRLRRKGELRKIKAWTRFDFPGRGECYSKFKWRWRHFTAIDYDGLSNSQGIFKFQGKRWAAQVDKENGNFDYLMGASLDLGDSEVQEELLRWGEWFITITEIDGFRLDAVKHMRFSFYRTWLMAMRKKFSKNYFAVGEYWSRYLEPLEKYMRATGGIMSLFDAPLHYNFYEASRNPDAYDLRTIFDQTFTSHDPAKSVTFVDNHDTQPGQALESWVLDWFRPLAYALILLRAEGYPCVFYGDYYGFGQGRPRSMFSKIQPLLLARKLYAYGAQKDYMDDPKVIGWIREGDMEHPNSGLAVVLSSGSAAPKAMRIGEKYAGCFFQDLTGNIKETVKISENGIGNFKVESRSVSVWARINY